MSDEPQPQQPNEGVAPGKPLPAEGPGKPGGREEKATEHHTTRPGRPAATPGPAGTRDPGTTEDTGNRQADRAGGVRGAGGAGGVRGAGGRDGDRAEGARRGPGAPNRDADRAGGTGVDRSAASRSGPGRPEAGRSDSGRPGAGRSGSGEEDAGRSGLGRPDAGRVGRAVSDSGRSEAGRPDAGRFGSGRPDAGRSDAGRPDSGRSEAGRSDSGRGGSGQERFGRSGLGSSGAGRADRAPSDSDRSGSGQERAGRSGAVAGDGSGAAGVPPQERTASVARARQAAQDARTDKGSADSADGAGGRKAGAAGAEHASSPESTQILRRVTPPRSAEGPASTERPGGKAGRPDRSGPAAGAGQAPETTQVLRRVGASGPKTPASSPAEPGPADAKRPARTPGARPAGPAAGTTSTTGTSSPAAARAARAARVTGTAGAAGAVGASAAGAPAAAPGPQARGPEATRAVPGPRTESASPAVGAPGGPEAGTTALAPGDGDGDAPTGKKAKKKGKRPKRTGWRRLLPTWRMVLGTCFVGVLLVIGVFFVGYSLVNIPPANAFATKQSNVYLYADGSQLARDGEVNRENVSLAHVSKAAQHAILAAEDRDFYSESAVDPKAMLRAAWNTATGKGKQSGSTITQQYVKNYYLAQEQTVTRKAKEFFISIKLDQNKSKDEILEGYLNTSYFGRNAYGIQAAAQAYYGRDAEDLDPARAAYLAALVNAPSEYDVVAHPENRKAAVARWNYVLDGMVKKGWLKQSERTGMKFPMPKEQTVSTGMSGQRGYLVEAVNQYLTGNNIIDTDHLEAGGYRIITTIRKDRQDAFVKAVDDQLMSKLDKKNRKADTYVRAGGASVDPKTGEVVALYGGIDYVKQYTNGATRGDFQVGSTFKPFVFTSAVENGSTTQDGRAITPNTVYDGTNQRPVQGWSGGAYAPENEDQRSYGPITVRKATDLSVNSVYAQMATDVGPAKVKQTAVDLGVPADTPDLYPSPSIALGTATASVLEMTEAYATLANHGKHGTYTLVEEVTKDGRDEIKLPGQKVKQAVSREAADTTTSVLRSVVESGTATAAQAAGRPAAGKTGTAESDTAAWFAGYTPDLATVVAVMGQDPVTAKHQPLYGALGQARMNGGGPPTEIWAQYTRDALKGKPAKDFDLRLQQGADQIQEPPATDTPEPGTDAGQDDGTATTDGGQDTGGPTATPTDGATTGTTGGGTTTTGGGAPATGGTATGGTPTTGGPTTTGGGATTDGGGTATTGGGAPGGGTATGGGTPGGGTAAGGTTATDGGAGGGPGGL